MRSSLLSSLDPPRCICLARKLILMNRHRQDWPRRGNVRTLAAQSSKPEERTRVRACLVPDMVGVSSHRSTGVILRNYHYELFIFLSSCYSSYHDPFITIRFITHMLIMIFLSIPPYNYEINYEIMQNSPVSFIILIILYHDHQIIP